MKTTLLLFSLCFSLVIKAQQNPLAASSTWPEEVPAVANNAKDTLFIADNEGGKQIKTVWDNDDKYVGKKPVIIVVPPNVLYIKQKYYRAKQ
jgi:hypothetical protein